MFTWNESFMVGEPAIDLQHKLLIETFNELECAIEEHKGHLEIKKILIFFKTLCRLAFLPGRALCRTIKLHGQR